MTANATPQFDPRDADTAEIVSARRYLAESASDRLAYNGATEQTEDLQQLSSSALHQWIESSMLDGGTVVELDARALLAARGEPCVFPLTHPEDAAATLAAEGHDEADVLAAIDSFIGSGLEYDTEANWLTDGEVDVVRDQLQSAIPEVGHIRALLAELTDARTHVEDLAARIDAAVADAISEPNAIRPSDLARQLDLPRQDIDRRRRRHENRVAGTLKSRRKA